MRISRVLPCAVAVAVAAAGCSAGPITVSASPSHASRDHNGDASTLISDAASAMRDTASAHVLFSSTGVHDLTADSYDADVLAAPPAAQGSANLLINGERVQTGFKVADGQLLIETVDGEMVDAGPAQGQFDPPALLDRATGLAALIGSVQDAVPAKPADSDADRGRLKLQAQLPAASATILVPRSSLGSADYLPTTLWFDPAANNAMVQLVAGVGTGSVTLRISASEHAAATAASGQAAIR